IEEILPAHPEIAGFFPRMFVPDDEAGVIEMEEIAGKSLEAHLRTPRGAEYLLKALECLETLESLPTPVFHTDLAPVNIRITPEGEVKFIDPESLVVFEGSRGRSISDVRAGYKYLQIQTMAENIARHYKVRLNHPGLLSLFDDFTEENLREEMRGLDDFARQMRLWRPAAEGVPAELLRVIHKGMLADPSGRYESMGELIRDFKDALTGARIADETGKIFAGTNRLPSEALGPDEVDTAFLRQVLSAFPRHKRNASHPFPMTGSRASTSAYGRVWCEEGHARIVTPDGETTIPVSSRRQGVEGFGEDGDAPAAVLQDPVAGSRFARKRLLAGIQKVWEGGYDRLAELILRFKDVPGASDAVERFSAGQLFDGGDREVAGEFFAAARILELLGEGGGEILSMSLMIPRTDRTARMRSEVDLTFYAREGNALGLEAGVYLVEAKEDRGVSPEGWMNSVENHQVAARVECAHWLRKRGIEVKGILVVVGGPFMPDESGLAPGREWSNVHRISMQFDVTDGKEASGHGQPADLSRPAPEAFAHFSGTTDEKPIEGWVRNLKSRAGEDAHRYPDAIYHSGRPDPREPRFRRLRPTARRSRPAGAHTLEERAQREASSWSGVFLAAGVSEARVRETRLAGFFLKGESLSRQRRLLQETIARLRKAERGDDDRWVYSEALDWVQNRVGGSGETKGARLPGRVEATFSEKTPDAGDIFIAGSRAGNFDSMWSQYEKSVVPSLAARAVDLPGKQLRFEIAFSPTLKEGLAGEDLVRMTDALRGWTYADGALQITPSFFEGGRPFEEEKSGPGVVRVVVIDQEMARGLREDPERLVISDSDVSLFVVERASRDRVTDLIGTALAATELHAYEGRESAPKAYEDSVFLKDMIQGRPTPEVLMNMHTLPADFEARLVSIRRISNYPVLRKTLDYVLAAASRIAQSVLTSA
ncbi:MAG: hypothetical protein HQL11_03360, partial [Candidatus Omnitrophica bacterium]|nr:hypothetical protein [Candidatus Omnitrophota bacterium]